MHHSAENNQVKYRLLRTWQTIQHFAIPTKHVVHAVDHAIGSRHPNFKYLVGFDAKVVAILQVTPLKKWVEDIFASYVCP